MKWISVCICVITVGPVRVTVYQLSWTKHALGRNCLGHELSWVRVVLGMNCPGYELAWAQGDTGTSWLGYELAWVRQAKLQLRLQRLSDQQFYYPLRCVLYYKFDGTTSPSCSVLCTKRGVKHVNCMHITICEDYFFILPNHRLICQVHVAWVSRTDNPVRGSLLLAWYDLIPTLISNHMPSKVWYEIAYAFPNVSGATVEGWE